MSEFGLDSKTVIDETIAGQDIADLKSFITDKNYPFVSDQQNGSYSNQISFDLSGLVSNNAYLNLQNSYILMPMSSTLAADQAWTGAIPATAVVPKSNFVNLIDSIQVFVNNKQLVDQTTMSNLPVSILSKLEMSTADLKLEGRGLGITSDTYSAVVRKTAASAMGDGYLNNEPRFGSISSAATELLQNSGLNPRSAMFVDTDNTTLPAVGAVGATAVSSCRAQGVPYFSAGTTNTLVATWNFIAYIPLRRLADLFARFPLIKNSQIRLVLNLNLGSVAMTNAVTTSFMSVKSITQTAGNTFPMMMCPVTSAILPSATAGTNTLSIAVQSTAAAATATKGACGYPLLPNCRLFAQSMVVSPNYEERILANRQQTIRYLDWFQLSINNVAAGSSYSQTISTSLPNVALAAVFPFHNGSTLAGATPSGLFVATTGNQYQSPFDAAPEQTLPLGTGAFQQLNFQVNGSNVWTNNAQFTYDVFCQEVKSLSINGSLKRDVASGLMDLVDWQFSPVAICDLGDRVDAESDAYQSVVINGTNATAVSVDYKVFIGYWKTYSIDVVTGQMEKIF